MSDGTAKGGCLCDIEAHQVCDVCQGVKPGRPAPDRPPKTRERVAQCEDAITHLMRRVESLEARSPGTYTPEPVNRQPMIVLDELTPDLRRKNPEED